jgi:MFS family permease
MPVATAKITAVQRRTVRLLVLVEIISGLGVAMGISVGALLAQDLAGTALSGVTQSAAIIGGALIAVPASAVMSRYGRRPGLALCYLIGAVGGAIVLASAMWHSVPLLFLGFFLFGAANTGKYQSRYAAVDLAEPQRRGRQLSLVVWATTLGAVLGPNLAAPLGAQLGPYGVPTLAGPFAFAALSFLISALLLVVLLRPDPLLLAQDLAREPALATVAPGGIAVDPAVDPLAAVSATAATTHGATATATAAATATAGVTATTPDATAKSTQRGQSSLAAAARAVLASPAARLGMTSMALGHLVMVAVMSMTPVHIGETHSGPDTLRIVGFVISVHIAGMYGLSPVTGWLTDRVGRRPVILGGVALLIAACAVAGTAEHDTAQLTVGLILLGLGWSGTMVGGATLFTESVPVEVKARAQGLSDLATGLAGASAGVVSGVIVELAGYPMLALLAALATVPLIALALRPETTAALKVAD